MRSFNFLIQGLAATGFLAHQVSANCNLVVNVAFPSPACYKSIGSKAFPPTAYTNLQDAHENIYCNGTFVPSEKDGKSVYTVGGCWPGYGVKLEFPSGGGGPSAVVTLPSGDKTFHPAPANNLQDASNLTYAQGFWNYQADKLTVFADNTDQCNKEDQWGNPAWVWYGLAIDLGWCN